MGVGDMEILLAVACMLAFYLGFLCVRNRMELRSIYRQLEEVAAGSPVAFFNSLTSCQPLKASKKLMYPGLPFNT